MKSNKAKEYIEKEFISEYNDVEHYLVYYGEDGITLEKGRIGRCRRYADKAVSIAEHQVDDHVDCSILIKEFTQKLTEKQ